MKLSKICLIAVLLGSVAVIGCSDDGGGTGGTAGTGGTGGTGGGTGGTSGVDAEAECSVELCAEDSDLGRTAKAACIDEIESCLTTGEFTEQQCIAFGVETCSADAG